jgi:hypothetical protein
MQKKSIGVVAMGLTLSGLALGVAGCGGSAPAAATEAKKCGGDPAGGGATPAPGSEAAPGGEKKCGGEKGCGGGKSCGGQN